MSCARRLSLEKIHWQSCHFHPHAEQRSRRSLRLLLLHRPPGPCRRDVQRPQILPPKTHHGRALHWHCKALQHLTRWRELQHTSAFVHRHPVVAFHIHRRAIGPAAVRLAFHLAVKLHPGAAVRDLTRGHVKVKPVNAVLGRVGPVQRAVVGAEGQAVGGEVVGCHLAHAVARGTGRVGLQAPQRGIRRGARADDRARPEPACGVAPAIIQAQHSGVVLIRWQQGQAGEGGGVGTVLRRIQKVETVS